jgi:hypothetical protein
MGRLTDEYGIVPLWQPVDLAAGGDSETFSFANASQADIILLTGVLTAPGALSVFSGATAGAKTTALPFTYRLSGADYKAAAADQFGTDTAETDGILTLSATANDVRTVVIHLDAADLPDGHIWVTLALASGTAQFVAGIALLRGSRYQPAITSVPTT